MVIVKTLLKNVPERCTKCRFYRWDEEYGTGQKYCVITGKAPELKKKRPSGNWAIEKPGWCPLVDIGPLGKAL